MRTPTFTMTDGATPSGVTVSTGAIRAVTGIDVCTSMKDGMGNLHPWRSDLHEAGIDFRLPRTVVLAFVAGLERNRRHANWFGDYALASRLTAQIVSILEWVDLRWTSDGAKPASSPSFRGNSRPG